MTKGQRELITDIYKQCLQCKIHSNFIGFFGDTKVMHFINIRDSRGTIILSHHASKDGRNYQDSNNIRNSEMSKHEEEFANEIKKTLNQSEFLEELGYKKDDETTRGILDKFDNVFWPRHCGTIVLKQGLLRA